MAAKRFSEFTPIPLGQKMKVVGLFGVENTISEEQVYLLSQEEFVQVQEDAAKALLDSADAEDSSVLFKLSLSGAWTGNQTSNRSIQLDFVGTNGNRLTKSRDESVTTDVITLVSFFSVDANGFLVLNGTAPILRSNGNNFTISEVTLIAEQVTTQTSISEK